MLSDIRFRAEMRSVSEVADSMRRPSSREKGVAFLVGSGSGSSSGSSSGSGFGCFGLRRVEVFGEICRVRVREWVRERERFFFSVLSFILDRYSVGE